MFVAAFSSFGEKRQVSLQGGSTPLWRKDGKELFFLDALFYFGDSDGAASIPLAVYSIGTTR